MLRSLRIAVFGALFAVSALCVQARAEERFNPEDGVSSAVIKSSGYELTLTNGAVVKLIGASMVQRPDQDCMVHIPSLRRTIERGLRAGTLSPIGTAAPSTEPAFQGIRMLETMLKSSTRSATGCSGVVRV